MENSRLKISIKNEKLFCEEIVKFLTSTDIFNRTKTDVCEFLIYAANKYSSENFLFTNSNYENSILLNLKQSKIKLVKEDISVRYMSEEDNDFLFYKFLQNLGTKDSPYILEESDDGKKFEIYIEDNCLRNQIERYLKLSTHRSVDYSFNKELLSIKKADFLNLLVQFKGLNNVDELRNKIVSKEKNADLKDFGLDVVNELFGPWGKLGTEGVSALAKIIGFRKI